MDNSIAKERLYQIYRNYPDVVTLQQLCEMLGGIADSTARKLLRGDHYAHYKNMLKAKLPTKPLKGGEKK